MSIGKLSAFDVIGGNWSSYVDRLEMYFKVNKVEIDMKLPIMIASMGDPAYELLANLASPKKPAELKFTEAVDLLRGHLQPAPSVLAERFRFRQRRQNGTETVAEYVAELKKLSRYCKFGDGLNENLRDQFVCGLKSDLIRQRLFAEPDDLSFANAVKMANALEAAERDSAAVEPGAGSSAASGEAAASAVHAVAVSRARGRRGGRRADGAARAQAAGSARPAPQAAYANCPGCGARNHEYKNCRYRNLVCSGCREAGHIRRVCSHPGSTDKGRRAPKRDSVHYGEANEETSPSDNSESEEDVYNLSLNNYKAVSLTINIDGVKLKMEVDTGTAISCISKHTYDSYFSHRPIEECTTRLKFYDGSRIRPLGYIKPDVRYGTERRSLELFVIEGGTTSLLGRQWLSELKIPIPTFTCNHVVGTENKELHTKIECLLDRYKDLFSGGLGRYTGGSASLRVRAGAAPVFQRARPLPYSLRERVDAELDAMLRAGVIEPVECSEWASPLVPITKADGTLRICADYKATLNPVLLVDRYPLPKIEDVLVGLNGSQYFSKIDLSQAYNQVELDSSDVYTVINTHRGLFKYKRLVFGLASSPGIFQRIMCNLLRGIPNVQTFLDDVIVGGKTWEEHFQALESVFKRLHEKGLKLKRSKCVFLVEEVSYLGYIVSKEGIKADPTKVEAIQKMQRPRNVSELRSFLGLLNFFAKFIKNFSAILVPLYHLLKKNVDWHWTDECENTFNKVKKLLTSTEVLRHYDPAKPLILTCDASQRGVGGLISQPGPRGERPVAYISRTLNAAEKNYSQIHREALAIIFCMKKFHQYLYGRKFTLRTDHKPLVSIFGPQTGIPAMAASRMQRWAVIMSAYTYDIEYIKTNENSADGLSRLPVSDSTNKPNKIPEQTFLHLAQDALLLDYNDIKRGTKNDPILVRILSYIRDGWPAECEIQAMRPYFNRKNELYEELGCVMWGYRVVIPTSCRDKVLKIIHEPHMGIEKSKALARSYVWFPGIDEALETCCRACSVCAAHGDAPPHQTPRPWPYAAKPWTRVHLDFMGPIFGKIYLVAVDSTSKWLEVFQVSSTGADCTIAKLSELWSRWGIPRQLVTDNAKSFCSKEFESFVKSDGIEHVFTAPYHPSSNGAAENAVRTLKRVIKKAVTENCNVDKALQRFLLYYRNTDHSSTGECPAVLMLNRRLRTRLDALKPDREHKERKSKSRQVEAAGGADRQVKEGEDVWYRNYLKGEKWSPGTVVDRLGKNNFTIKDQVGNNIHRHVDQLKRRSRFSLVGPGDFGTQNSAPSTDKSSLSPGPISENACEPVENAIKSGDDAAGGSEQTTGLETPVTRDEVESVKPCISPRNTPSPKSRPVRSCRLKKK